MRKKLLIMAALSAILGLTAGTLSLASASNGTGAEEAWRDGIFSSGAKTLSSENNDGDERLVLVERNETETEIDNPPRGFSQGDEIAFAGDLFEGDTKVGFLDGHVVFTLVRQRLVRAHVTFTATVKGNEITAAGVAVFTETTAEFEFSVTGGTGKFDDVGGEVTVVERRRAVKLVYELEELG